MGTLVFQATAGGAVNLVGPNTASTVNFTLPSADGTSGQALVTNGTGTLSFSTVAGTPGGSNTQVQFNNSGAFGGSANLTFNGTTFTHTGASNFATSTGSVGIGTASPGSTLDVKGTLRLSGSSSGYVGFSPASAAGSTTYTLPSADGTSGQALVTNGTGTLSWSSASGGFSGATAVSSATTVTLTSASTQIQLVTMTAAGQFVVLPSATTMTKGAVGFIIQNMGAYPFGIKDGSGNIIFGSVNPYYTCNLSSSDSSTTGGKWTVVGSQTSLAIPFSYGATNLSSTTLYGSAFSGVDCCVLSSTTSLIVYQTGANAVSAVIATVSGNTVSLGTPVSLWSATYLGPLKLIGLSSTSAVVFTYSGAGNTIYGKAISISGSTITSGTTTTSGITAFDVQSAQFIADTSTTGLMVTSTTLTNIQAIAFSVSGTTITFGTGVSAITLNTGTSTSGCCVAKSATNTFVIVAANDGPDMKHRALSLSGTTITLGTTTTTDPTFVNYQFYAALKGGSGYPTVGLTGPSGWVSFSNLYGPYSVQYSGTTYVASTASFGGNAAIGDCARFTPIGSSGGYLFAADNAQVNSAYARIVIPVAASVNQAYQTLPNSNAIYGSGLAGGVAQLATNTALCAYAAQSGSSYYLATQVVTLNY
jgi:hypothetical protein